VKLRGQFTRDHLWAASAFARQASGAGVTVEIERSWSARYPHYNGFEVFLYGDGTLGRRRSAHDRDKYAATWEQWGHFINYLFQVDPSASIGRYRNHDDFGRQTRGLFPPVPWAVNRERTRAS
jgi:hypothetical protein